VEREHVRETVPQFRARLGDRVIEGSNGVLVVLGTDRPRGIASGLGLPDAAGNGRGTGTFHVVVGRTNADPDPLKDAAYIYLSAGSRPDDNLRLGSVGKDVGRASTFVVLADAPRTVYRKNVKVVSSDGKVHLVMDDKSATVTVGSSVIEVFDKKVVVKTGRIELGGDANSLAVFEKLKIEFDKYFHPSPVVPTGPPPPPGLLDSVSSNSLPTPVKVS